MYGAEQSVFCVCKQRFVWTRDFQNGGKIINISTHFLVQHTTQYPPQLKALEPLRERSVSDQRRIVVLTLSSLYLQATPSTWKWKEEIFSMPESDKNYLSWTGKTHGTLVYKYTGMANDQAR